MSLFGNAGNRSGNVLFGDDNHCLQTLRQEALSSIKNASNEEVLETDVEWYISTLIVNLNAEPVVLGAPTMDTPKETQVEAYDHFERGYIHVPGLVHRIKYPFTGYTPLLHRKPSTWYSMYPRGIVEGNTIVFQYALPGHDHADELKAEHERNFSSFQKFLKNANSDMQSFMATLPDEIATAIEVRKKELKSIHSYGDILGIPVEESGLQETETKKPLIKLREVIKKPGTRNASDPIDFAEFNGILEIIEYAGRQYERSPRMTHKWSENDFRDHLCVFLNYPYRHTGSVTGETFVKKGKTDILIRDQDMDIFIGECKIWRGQSTIKDDLDQLFERYITWSASKSALIYFNRAGNTTDVLDKIKSIVPDYKYCSALIGDKGPTRIHFKFKNPSDEKKVIDMAVVVFPV